MPSVKKQDSYDVLKVNAANLELLGKRIPTPAYDRQALSCGIVHMSVGGFHRSHEALYVDDILAQTGGNWLIAGVGLLDNDTQNVQALINQDHYYTILERSADEDTARIIGSIGQIMHAPANPSLVIKRLQDPAIKILSLTVTEKGYCYNEGRELDEGHPMIQHDLQNPDNPKSAIGYAVRALEKRKESGIKAFTIMSCDNLPGNGHIAKRIITGFASLRSKDLATWIEDNVSFPNAMVDRITPVTTDAVKQTLIEKFGIDDAWPVVCEDYRQWVLEDSFCQGRPDFESVGVQIVSDVEPYEKMKVRLLNGSHSALSYISYLMGYRDVDLAMADPLIRQFICRYMDEDITPTVPSVPGIDLASYKKTLIKRFSNPAVRDQILRLAEDGSQKIKNAIVPCLEIQLRTGGSIRWMAFAFAGWFRFLTGVDETMSVIPIKDPMAASLSARAKASPHNPEQILALYDIFGSTAATSPEVNREITNFLQSFHLIGVRKTLENALKN